MEIKMNKKITIALISGMITLIILAIIFIVKNKKCNEEEEVHGI
jgi:uncharacterized integral membrane protein